MSEEYVLEREVEMFLKLGDMYLLVDLKNLAEHKMMEIVNIDNVVNFFILGVKYRADNIREESKRLVQMNREILKRNRNWLDVLHQLKETDIVIDLLL